MCNDLEFKFLQLASRAFLCKQIPDCWYDMTKEEKNNFLRENAWQVLENWKAESIYNLR